MLDAETPHKTFGAGKLSIAIHQCKMDFFTTFRVDVDVEKRADEVLQVLERLVNV